MNQLTQIQDMPLPALIDRAATALSSARNSAEVLEARDIARVAYDAAKSAGRMARGKQAYDEVIGAVYRAQADALLIEARAKMRLADEYDAAQDRGEVACFGANQHRPEGVVDSNTLGIRRDEIHEGRKLRNAEAKDPGKTERALKGMLERGEEPTKAKLRREIEGENPVAETAPPDPFAKLRAEFRKLTREAQEDDWIALRAEVAEQRKRISAQTGQIADLKQLIKELTSGDDVGRALGNAKRALRDSEGRSKEYQSKAARLQKQVNAQKAEIAKLRKEIENAEVELN
jgi:hypothetical protein